MVNAGFSADGEIGNFQDRLLFGERLKDEELQQLQSFCGLYFDDNGNQIQPLDADSDSSEEESEVSY